MCRLKTLKGSTIIEVVLASVIYLTGLSIALSTVVPLLKHVNKASLYLDSDRQMKATLENVKNGSYSSGQYNYLWGEMTVEIKPYKDYPQLNELTISSILVNKKVIIYRYIIEISK